MHTVKIYEAKTHLSRLIEEVQDGSEVIISRGAKAVAKLVAYIPKKQSRKPGYLKGKIRIADDFDAPLPEELLSAFGCKNETSS
jgi:prevent-host-death family protein